MNKIISDKQREEIEKKIKKNPSTIKELKALVSKLEDNARNYKLEKIFTDKHITKMEDVVKDLEQGLSEAREENKALEDEVEDLEKIIELKTDCIEELKKQNIDLMTELVQERERKAAYKEDSKQTLKANQELRKILKEKDEILQTTKKLLKAVL